MEPANKKRLVNKVDFLFSITLLSDCDYQGEDNKINTMLFNRYFINKTIKSLHTFEKSGGEVVAD